MVMPEVQSVHSRCRECGQATHFAVVSTELDDSGEERVYVRVDELPHTKADCAMMQKLEREQWPTLF